MATAKATKKRPAPGPPDASRGRRRPRPDGLVVEVSGLAWPHRSRQNCVAMSPDADGGFASNWFAAPDIVGGVVHRFTFSADIGADAHVAKWIVRLETRAKSGLDRAIAFTNFRFSYTKLWSVYVKLWSVYVTWFCFALELALEGPPGPLADGHLLPHA